MLPMCYVPQESGLFQTLAGLIRFSQPYLKTSHLSLSGEGHSPSWDFVLSDGSTKVRRVYKRTAALRSDPTA